MSAALRTGWERFFFAPAGPDNLGICRVLFYGAMLICHGQVDLAAWGTVSTQCWLPVSTFKHFHLPVLSEGWLQGMQVLWRVALLLSMAGLATRLSTTAAFLLGFYLLGLPHNFGKLSHAEGPVVIVAGILMFARCGDAWSLDALRRRPRRPGHSGEYTWPIRLVWLALALAYFAAGIAKLRAAGLDWVDSLPIYLIIAAHYGLSDWVVPSLSLMLAQHGGICRVVAAAALMLELSYPLALISPRWRRLCVPVMVAGHLAILVLLGPDFTSFMVCSLFWAPWDRLVDGVNAMVRWPDTMAFKDVAGCRSAGGSSCETR